MAHKNAQQSQLSNDQRKGLTRLLEKNFTACIKKLDQETSRFRERVVAKLAKEFDVNGLVKRIQALRKEQDTLEAKLGEIGFTWRYGDLLEVTGGKAEKRYEAESAQYEAFAEYLRSKSEQLSKRLWLANTREEAEQVLAEGERYTAKEPNTETTRG